MTTSHGSSGPQRRRAGGRRRTGRTASVPGLAGYLRSDPRRGSTTDLVTDALREAILDGAMPPGTWIREGDLARDLSVSRTPIREALRRLDDEGLVNKTAHQGTVVASMTVEDILAVYIVRRNLEGLAARLAANRRPAGLVAELEDNQDRMRAVLDQPDKLASLNLEFHRAIRTATGNPYLERFLTQVEHAVRRIPGTTFSFRGRPEATVDEHEAVIRAIAAGDSEAADQAARDHMTSARDLRVRSLLGA
ncbi:MAG: GntR family transcriptional regulator [Streptomycetales bacterium]